MVDAAKAITIAIASLISVIWITAASAATCPENRNHAAAMAFLREPPAATDIREIGLPAARDIVGRLVALTQMPPPFAIADVASAIAYQSGDVHYLKFFNSAACLIGSTGTGMSKYVAEAVDGTGA